VDLSRDARALGLDGALAALLALLRAEAERHGDRPGSPGWTRESVWDHAEHLASHAARVVAEPHRLDPDSGRPEALHVAARALFICAKGRDNGQSSMG
jgi:hypothetical protein